MPPPIVVADLGTGSGAIGLALADELPVVGVEVWLTDDDGDALNVARANLAGIGRGAANVRIVAGRWFDALPEDVRLDVVVANPPYVADGSPDVDQSVLQWEPHHALFAGPDGLDAIREVVAGAPARLRPGGWLVLEIGADQGAAVADLLSATGDAGVEIRQDLPAATASPASPADLAEADGDLVEDVPSSGVTVSSTPASSRAAENSAMRRTRLVIRASMSSSSSLTVPVAHARREVAIA